MAKSSSKLEALKGALSECATHYKLLVMLAQCIEEFEANQYALREDVKMLRAMASSADRTSRECMLKLADIIRESRH